MPWPETSPAVGGLAVLVCMTLVACSRDTPAVAEVLREHPAQALRWSSIPAATAVSDPDASGPVLRITVPAGPAGSGTSVQQDVMGRAIALHAGRQEVTRPLDLDGLRGWRVELTARLRYAGIPRPPAPWEGVRLGVDFTTPLGDFGAGYNGLWGDSPWREVRFRLRIPADATDARLAVGLIATTGTLWLDEVRLTRIEAPLADQVVAGWTPPPTGRRGVRLGNAGGGAIARVARDWGANIVKLVVALPAPDQPPAAYQAALDRALDAFAGELAEVEAAGVTAILQVAIPAAWSDPTLGGTHRVYLEPALAERFVASWRRIASRFHGRPGIWGYDLLNETVLRVPPAAGCPDWEGLAERTAQAINAIDPAVRILVQPEEWWGMRAFEKLRPINARNVVYSPHMYAPFALTHQGVRSRSSEGHRYPGLIDGTRWDKQRLRQALQSARNFQLAHRVPMQVGEFSCIRWAPDGSAARWLADCTTLFEEYGWDYTYHAACDWDGWSVEMGEDPADQRILLAPGPAKRVLLERFARNRTDAAGAGP